MKLGTVSKIFLLNKYKFQNNNGIIPLILLKFYYTANFFNASLAASCSASFFD